MGSTGVEQGYLVLADISGYTAFLTGNELEHATGIVDDLTRAIVGELTRVLTLVKLEGDAVFVYAPVESWPDGERVLEAIEACYVAFCDQQADIARQTTCPCSACANIAALNLKVVAHAGAFVTSHEHGRADLAGPDVIVVHRMLKNSIIDALDIPAYAFLSDAFTARLPHPLDLPSHTENYPDVGPVAGCVEDLAGVAAGIRAERRIVIEPGEADLEVASRFNAPPAVVWDWYVNPQLAERWQTATGLDGHPNPDGRAAAGAELHCAHGRGRSVHRVVDWKPFDYFTQDVMTTRRSLTAPPPSVATFDFAANDDGTTTVTFRARLKRHNAATKAVLRVARPAFARQFRASERRLNDLLAAQNTPT
jgi:hypothetical protein